MPITLTSRWFIRPGREERASEAICRLADKVQANEPGTLVYLAHRPAQGDARLQSLPPTDPSLVVFYERYADAEAFLAHLNGPIFAEFLSDSGDCFLGTHGKPYTTVEFLDTFAGFSQRPGAQALDEAASETGNRHPSVVFEILVRDAPRAKSFYQKVFGWDYDDRSHGVSYIHFPVGLPPLLGLVGQANKDDPAFDAGTNFYLLVDDLEPMLKRAFKAGAKPLMAPTKIDEYRLAMFRDPEGNAIGLIEPFRH